MRPDGVMVALQRMGAPVTEPGFRPLVVVAHPDDETLGTGGLLLELGQGLVVHVTDGAPRDLGDAQNAGCATRRGYAAVRRRELLRALAEAGLSAAEAMELGAVDQEAVHQAAALAQQLATVMAVRRPGLVVTHTYEGGHPDHDATALIVRAALSLLARAGEPVPAVLEFPTYHRREDALVAGEFISGQAAGDGLAVELPDDLRQAKQRMLDCFVSQQRVLAALATTRERYRLAARHRFDRPPHEGQLHYETLGWSIDGAAWRRHAQSALDALGLDACGEQT